VRRLHLLERIIMLKSIFLSTVAIAGLSLSANAADLTEDVVVSATRIATPIAQTGSSVTVITAADIEARQDRTLPDALQEVPGLSVVQSGGMGGQTSLFMRGSNSNQTKILLDGIDIADPSTPNNAADIGKLLTGNIARIEVLRGPQSGLYGSDAIGGVISIVTKSGQGSAHFTASAEGGSFGTFNQRATVGGSFGDFHYAASFDHVHSDATPVTPLTYLLPGEKRNNDSYDGVMASTKLGYDITDNFDLGLVAHYDASLGKVTTDGFSLVTFTAFPAFTRARIATQQYDTRGTAHLVLWDGRFDQTVGLAYSSTITSSADPVNFYSLAKGSRTKLDWQGNIAVAEGETVVLGAETARDAMHGGYSSGLPSKLSVGTTTNAGYGELQSVWGDFANSASIRYDDNSRFGSKVTYHVAPTYTVTQTGTRLKASFGTGFKTPSLQQLFGPFGHNIALKPETSTGYDAGFEQDIWGDVLTGGATWFHNDIKNLIISGPPPTFAPGNIGKARTQGVESFVAWKALETLSLRADYTYTDAIDTTTVNKALLRRPRNKASLGADWQALPDLLLNATLLHVGPQVDVNRATFVNEKLASYTVVNFAAQYRLNEAFSVFGRLENAFDNQYQSPDGFQRPGIGAYAGIKANF
jgi:vitamin B12 transporter